jgi:hypothetical protein
MVIYQYIETRSDRKNFLLDMPRICETRQRYQTLVEYATFFGFIPAFSENGCEHLVPRSLTRVDKTSQNPMIIMRVSDDRMTLKMVSVPHLASQEVFQLESE